MRCCAHISTVVLAYTRDSHVTRAALSTPCPSKSPHQALTHPSNAAHPLICDASTISTIATPTPLQCLQSTNQLFRGSLKTFNLKDALSFKRQGPHSALIHVHCPAESGVAFLNVNLTNFNRYLLLSRRIPLLSKFSA